MPDFLRLPRGITGFAQRREDLPWVDAAHFKQLCYVAARAVGGSVRRFDSAEGEVDRNFHVAEVQLDSECTAILCNAHHPWLALAELTATADLAFALRWKEVPALARTLRYFPNFCMLDITYLEAPPEPHLLQNLWAGEIKEIRSWHPQRIGEIIFNSWD